jgi:hypothetical protein
MQRMAAKTPAMNTKSLTSVSYGSDAENVSPLVLFQILVCAADRIEPREAARSPHWVKVKNLNAPGITREAEEDWGR